MPYAGAAVGGGSQRAIRRAARSPPVTAPAPEARASTPDDDARRDALAGRLFEALLGAFDLLSVQLGLELGLYRALRDGPAHVRRTSPPRPASDPRYAREWLEQQAVTGCSTSTTWPPRRTSAASRCRPAHAEVLLDPDGLATMTPWPLVVSGVAEAGRRSLAAYRTGGGIHWNAYPALIGAPGGRNRPLFRHLLAQEWLPAIPDVDARLREPAARVADVGVRRRLVDDRDRAGLPGGGVDGLDLDARRSRAPGPTPAPRRSGTGCGSTSSTPADPGSTAVRPGHDLRGASTTWHDRRGARGMPPAARARRRVLVVDEKVAEQFTAPGDDIERLMYGYSVFVCLANGLRRRPSAAPARSCARTRSARYAADAGFARRPILPDRARGVPLLPPGSVAIPVAAVTRPPFLTRPGPEPVASPHAARAGSGDSTGDRDAVRRRWSAVGRARAGDPAACRRPRRRRHARGIRRTGRGGERSGRAGSGAPAPTVSPAADHRRAARRRFPPR